MDQITLIKTIFKNSHVNFLIGAGASHNLIKGKCHYPLMYDLLKYVRDHTDVKEFCEEIKSTSLYPEALKSLICNIFEKYLYEENSNVEKFLSVLEGADLYIQDEKLKSKIRDAKDLVKSVIRKRIMISDDDTVITNYAKFYRGLKKLKESNAIKNQTFNVFTTNYDMLNEKAMEDLNIHYYSGFEGVVSRKFNMAYYNYGFVDDFVVSKSKVEIKPEHINLFKLHGSLSWCLNDEDELVEKNPYELEFLPEIIYPSVNKFNNTNLIISYSALMREFSNRLCQRDTALFVSGLSMGDEHINKIIENALTITSFHLIIFAYGKQKLINELKSKYAIYHNVIVLDDSFSFEQVADLLLSIEGGTLHD